MVVVWRLERRRKERKNGKRERTQEKQWKESKWIRKIGKQEGKTNKAVYGNGEVLRVEKDPGGGLEVVNGELEVEKGTRIE